MSQAKLSQLSSGRIRRLAIVKPSGVLVDVREMHHADRVIAHRKMRQTWMQTFIGFVGLSALIAVCIWVFGSVEILGIFGILWLSVSVLAWFFSSKIAPAAVGAYDADPSTEYGAAAIRCADKTWAQLIAYVTEHYGERAAKLLKRPRVMLSPNKHANAFCTGRGWNDSVICIFEGAFLSGMTEDEISAVLAHELGHYFHLDVFLQTIASVLGAVFSLTVAGAAKRWVKPLFARLPRWLSWLGWLSNIALIVGFRFSGIFVKVVQMFISRSREASADAFAVEITDDPCALARALKKLVAYEVELAKKEREEEDKAKKQDPSKFHALQLARFCEEAVLDALGIMLFIETVETVEHQVKHAAGHKPSKLEIWWHRLMENHPPVNERCEWLELAAGHACPCPGVDEKLVGIEH